MRKNMTKEMNNKVQHSSDTAVNRMMLMFLLATVAIFSLLYVKKSATRETFFMLDLCPILSIVFGVLLIAALVWFIYSRSKAIDESNRIFTSSNVLGMVTTLFVLFLSYKYIMSYAIVALAIVAALYLIHCLFKKDFFYFSVLCAMGFVFFYSYRDISVLNAGMLGIVYLIIRILAFVIPIAVLVLLLILKKNKGVLNIGKKAIQVMYSDYKYYPLVAVSVFIMAACVFLMFFSTFVLYAVCAMIALFVVIAVISALEMM